MQRLEDSGAVRLIYGSLGVKRLNDKYDRQSIVERTLCLPHIYLCVTCFISYSKSIRNVCTPITKLLLSTVLHKATND